MIGVEAVSETVFEGSLTGDAIDEPISVVIIHNPEDSSALVCFFKHVVFVLMAVVQNMLSRRHNTYIYMYRCLIDQFPPP